MRALARSMTLSQTPQVMVAKGGILCNASFTILHSSRLWTSDSDNYKVLAELTSVADAVWIWATHEATLEEWDLAGMFPGNFVSKKSIFPKQVGPLYSLPPLLFT